MLRQFAVQFARLPSILRAPGYDQRGATTTTLKTALGFP
jgi:hypothetical protein